MSFLLFVIQMLSDVQSYKIYWFGFVSMIEWLAGLLFGRHNYRLDMLKIDSKETKFYC